MRKYLVLFLMTLNLSAYGYTLEEILSLSRQQAKSPQLSLSNAEEIKALSGKADLAFDTQLNARFSETNDEGPLNQYTAGDQRYGVKREWQVSKYFASGTSVAIGNHWNQQKVFSDLPLQQYDPLQLPRFNPLHEVEYSVTIQQDLWKNFAAHLVTLQREVAKNQAINPEYQSEIEIQNIQYEAATIYLEIVALNGKLSLAIQLEDESENFLNLIKERKRIGRADDVDIATAETELIKRTGSVLTIRLTRDSLITRLQHLTLGTNKKFTKTFPQSLPNVAIRENLEYLTKKAYENRVDLKMIAALESSIQLQNKLYDEEDKPAVGAFVDFRKRGLGSNFNEAQDDVNNGTLMTYGLNLQWNFGGTSSKQNRLAANYRNQNLEIQKQMIEDKVAQGLSLAIQNLKGSRQQESQSLTHINSLSKKISAERIKLQQARSDKAALSRYQIELIVAKMEKVDAEASAQRYANEIRWLSHNYPRQIFN